MCLVCLSDTCAVSALKVLYCPLRLMRVISCAVKYLSVCLVVFQRCCVPCWRNISAEQRPWDEARTLLPRLGFTKVNTDFFVTTQMAVPSLHSPSSKSADQAMCLVQCYSAGRGSLCSWSRLCRLCFRDCWCWAAAERGPTRVACPDPPAGQA